MLLSLLQPGKSDIKDLALLERLSDVIDNWTPDEFQGLLDEADMVFSLLQGPDGSPQGYYALLLPDGDSTPHTHLLTLTIHPSHRRQGLGRALFCSIPPTYVAPFGSPFDPSGSAPFGSPLGSPGSGGPSAHTSPPSVGLRKKKKERVKHRVPLFPMVATVRESDLVAQLFLKAVGFRVTKVPREFDCPPERGFTFYHPGPTLSCGV